MTWLQIVSFGVLALVVAAFGDLILRYMRRQRILHSSFTRQFRKSPKRFGIAAVFEPHENDRTMVHAETNIQGITEAEALAVIAGVIDSLAEKEGHSPMELYEKLEKLVTQVQAMK